MDPRDIRAEPKDGTWFSARCGRVAYTSLRILLFAASGGSASNSVWICLLLLPIPRDTAFPETPAVKSKLTHSRAARAVPPARGTATPARGCGRDAGGDEEQSRDEMIRPCSSDKMKHCLGPSNHVLRHFLRGSRLSAHSGSGCGPDCFGPLFCSARGSMKLGRSSAGLRSGTDRSKLDHRPNLSRAFTGWLRFAQRPRGS